MLNTVRQTDVKQLSTLKNNKPDKHNIYKNNKLNISETFRQVLQFIWRLKEFSSVPAQHEANAKQN